MEEAPLGVARLGRVELRDTRQEAQRRAAGERLEHLGVRAYPKLTGSRGIQAWIPIERGRYSYAETSAWVETLSRAVGAAAPALVSWEWSKSERGGRARLD